MTADVEMLPCPFCRNEACMDGKSGSWGYYPATAFVRCRKCNARGPTFHDDEGGSRNYRAEAAAAWNRRATAAKDAAIASLSAPQPPAEAQAQGGGEVVYQLAGECDREWLDCSEAVFEWWQGKDRKSRKLYAAPPSAPVGVEDVAENAARAMYSAWVDSQDIHCNRFPAWHELPGARRADWFNRVVEADTGVPEADNLIGRLMHADPTFGDCTDAAAYIRKLALAQQPAAVDEVLTPTGTFCSICEAPQHNTPSGVSCPRGHGGAKSITAQPGGEK